MRLSRLLGKTLRQPPSEAHLPSHQLLVRAGYVRGVEAGLFAYLPLGHLSLERLKGLVRQALAVSGGQEIDLPPVPDTQPAQTLTRLVRREVGSYRQLPVLLFRSTTQPVEQPRTRGGLFSASERPVVEVSALAEAGMTKVQGQVKAAIEQILTACDVPVVWAKAGDNDQLALFAHPAGDEDLVFCPACGYAAERSWATTSYGVPPAARSPCIQGTLPLPSRWPDAPDEEELPPEDIETPDCNTIAALAQFLDIPAAQTLKMVFYSVEKKVNCIVIRGDRAVDEAKLARVLGTTEYYASLEEELAAIGAVGGYASPIGLDQSRVRVVADPSVRSGKNFVSGANRPGYHIQNVNVPRDFAPGEWADLALVEPDDPCPQCRTALEVERAFALAHSAAPVPCNPKAEYLDAQGRGQPLWLASWRLDLGRLLAAVVEGHYDDYGLLWPIACAPFDVHMVVLDARREAVAAQAKALYKRLRADGFSVLYDDRPASAGVKFNDADLIGLPLRLTVSKRSAKDGLVEAKWRDGKDRLKLDDEGLAAELARLR